MKKLFVSDLDGTLLKIGDNHSQGISVENKNAINEFVRAGNIFAVATARGKGYQSTLAKELNYNLDYIANNGSVLLIKDNNAISYTINPKYYYEIIHLIEKNNIDATLCFDTEDGFFYSGSQKYPFNDNNALHNSDFLNQVGKAVTTSIDTLVIYKIICLISPNEMTQTRTLFKKHFCNKLEVVSSDIDLIDFMPLGCSKGSGIEEIARLHGISKNNVGVVGDSDNDVSMFIRFDNSYCMNHSDKDVKEKASKVVETVADALYDFMKQV